MSSPKVNLRYPYTEWDSYDIEEQNKIRSIARFLVKMCAQLHGVIIGLLHKGMAIIC